MGTVTLEGVEIVRAGAWASQLSGRVPISTEDLDAMVQAASDPEIDHAPLRIGHVDPRFDGEPALGWLTNVRRVGDRVVADITDVPAKLADVVRSAFRRRSAEIMWGVKTPSGRRYKAALSGLALLGLTPPAVKGLADVLSRYSGPTNQAESTGVAVTIDDIDDPNAAESLSLLTEQLASRDRNRPPLPDHGANGPAPRGDRTVNDEQIRALLGLAADAPITDQMRAVAAQHKPADPAADAAAAQAKADVDAKAAADKAAADAKAEADRVAAAAGALTTTIDSAALQLLQQQAADGAQALKQLYDADRERDLANALSGGQIAPASVAQWRAMWDTNKEQTKTLLAGLPVVYSTVTTVMGSSADSSVNLSGTVDDAAWDGFMESLGSEFAPPRKDGK